MEQTATEKLICDSCGVDVRPNSMFCYNCGGDVSAAVPENGQQISTKSVQTAAETSKLEIPVKSEAAETEANKAEIEKAIDADINKKAENAVEKESKLKTAASMRRQSKAFQRKTVEVVWEEPQNTSLLRLILVTLLLVIFAAVIVYLAVLNK